VEASYGIRSHTLCKGIDESKSPDGPIDPTHTFYDSDQQVVSLVILENMDRSYDISTKWFTPAGDLFKKFDEVTEDPHTEGATYWEYYSTNSTLFLQGEDVDAKKSPGQWRVDFYINDELQFTDSFELKSTQSYSISSYTTCRGVDESEYPYKPIDPTTVLSDTDERVYCLTILENVYGSHTFESKFFNPSGNQYNSSEVQIPDAKTSGYDYWTSYSIRTSIPIRGMEAANLPGQWRIDVYLDNQLEFQIDFQIVSTKTATTQTTSKYVVQTAEWTLSTVMTSAVTNTSTEAFFLSGNALMATLGLVVIVVIAAVWLVMRSRRKPRYEPRHEPGLPESV
jgi:hypothetical protein